MADTVIYNETIIPHLKAVAPREVHAAFFDENGKLGSMVFPTPPMPPYTPPILFNIKESDQSFFSEHTGATVYESVSELIIAPPANKAYFAEFMLYISDITENEHPFLVRVHANHAWASSIYGHHSNLIQSDNYYTEITPQHLEAEGPYLTIDNIVGRAALHIKGYIVVEDEESREISIEMRNATVGELGTSDIKVLAGSWMKLTPVTDAI